MPVPAYWLAGENDGMDWPVRFPAEMRAGTISVRRYDPADAAELLGPLADERVWGRAVGITSVLFDPGDPG